MKKMTMKCEGETRSNSSRYCFCVMYLREVTVYFKFIRRVNKVTYKCLNVEIESNIKNKINKNMENWKNN